MNINEPALLTTALSLNNNVSCSSGSDGSATATPSGGTMPYTYAWDNTETDQTATALNAGMHTVTVTDMNGCEATGQVMITEPTPLSVIVDGTHNRELYKLRRDCISNNDGRYGPLHLYVEQR